MFDESRDRLAILTLGAALIWRISELTIDAARLRQITDCVNEIDPVTGVAKPIDVAACNRLNDR